MLLKHSYWYFNRFMLLKTKSVIFSVIVLPMLYSRNIKRECRVSTHLLQNKAPFFSKCIIFFLYFPNLLNHSDCVRDIYTHCLMLYVNLVFPFKNHYKKLSLHVAKSARICTILKWWNFQLTKCPLVWSVQISLKCLSVITVQVPKLLEVPNFSMFVSSLSALILTRIDDKNLCNI